jgi:hypothetical protein
MVEKEDPTGELSNDKEFPTPPVCAHCGSPEAKAFDDLFICDACYIASGSCCAGDDDGS